jgi:methanethiol S-methyltransferase
MQREWESTAWRARIGPMPAMLINSKAAIYALLVSAIVLATAAFILFGFFLWHGPFPAIRLVLTTPQALAFDTLLALTFFAQHSGMVRRSFRTGLTRWIAADTQPAVYAIVSAIALLSQPLLWQPTGMSLVTLHGPLRWLIRAVFLAGAAWMVWAIASLPHFDAFGVEPLLARLRARPAPQAPLTIRGAYRWVRHPIYSSLILMFWAWPDVTADRLLFNLLWSAWMVAATHLEERDLVADFGQPYRDYQRRVPMLLPHSLRPPG